MTLKIEVPINIKGGSGKKIGEQIAATFAEKSKSLMKSIGGAGGSGAAGPSGGKGTLKIAGILGAILATLDAMAFLVKPILSLLNLLIIVLLLPFIPIMKTTMVGIAVAIKLLLPIMKKVGAVVEKVWMGFLDFIHSVIFGLVDSFKIIASALGKAWDAIRDAGKWIWDMFVTGFKVFLGIGEWLWNTMVDGFQVFLNIGQWLFDNLIKPGFDFFVNIGVMIWELIKSPFEWLAGKIRDIWDFFKGFGVGGGSKSKFGVAGNILGFAQGGIVPGAKGAPQLAVVHGGEEVIPVGGSRGITININNPVVRNDSDIKRLAQEVSMVMQRKLGRRVLNG